jgi:hypothetical protein
MPEVSYIFSDSATGFCVSVLSFLNQTCLGIPSVVKVALLPGLIASTGEGRVRRLTYGGKWGGD